MPKASDLKSGMIVQVREQPHIVKQVQANNPSARGAATLYKVRFNHASTGQKLDESLKGGDFLPEVDFQRRQVHYSYKDGDSFIFMDSQDYSQYPLDGDKLGDVALFLSEGLSGITALLIEDTCVSVQIPTVVEMPIVETPPAMKAASASARSKTAKLSTGLEIQVPEYLGQGEMIKINTETKDFVSRA